MENEGYIWSSGIDMSKLEYILSSEQIIVNFSSDCEPFYKYTALTFFPTNT